MTCGKNEEKANKAEGCQVLTPVESLPPGAQRIHMGNIESTFCPRGTLEKESMSEYLLERLESLLDYWTRPEYADSLPRPEAVSALVKGLRDEVDVAIAEFLRHHPS